MNTISQSPDAKIIVYATSWCPDCHRARRLLDEAHAAYEWIDINDNAAARAQVIAINHGNRSVPTIIFPDGDILVEPSNSVLMEKLNAPG